jgi:hypothetical protein
VRVENNEDAVAGRTRLFVDETLVFSDQGFLQVISVTPTHDAGDGDWGRSSNTRSLKKRASVFEGVSSDGQDASCGVV